MTTVIDPPVKPRPSAVTPRDIATAGATRRARDGDFDVLAGELARMREADEADRFIDAQATFHHVLVLTAGNRVLAQTVEPLQRALAGVRLARTGEPGTTTRGRRTLPTP